MPDPMLENNSYSCASGYSGSYCEVGFSRGVPPGTAAIAVLLTVILIIIIGTLAIGAFFNYRKTGSLMPTLPKLPSLSSLVKSTENSNGVTFRSGADITMDDGVSGFGADSTIDRAMQLSDSFTVDPGKQPITFENPMYATSGEAGVSVATVDQPAKITISNAGQTAGSFENPFYATLESFAPPRPSPSADTPQELKWSFFKRKLKQSTNFDNPIYGEMEKERKGDVEDAPTPSTSPPPEKPPHKIDQPHAYTPTEDTFRDTATLVKEDSDV